MSGVRPTTRGRPVGTGPLPSHGSRLGRAERGWFRLDATEVARDREEVAYSRHRSSGSHRRIFILASARPGERRRRDHDGARRASQADRHAGEPGTGQRLGRLRVQMLSNARVRQASVNGGGTGAPQLSQGPTISATVAPGPGTASEPAGRAALPPKEEQTWRFRRRCLAWSHARVVLRLSFRVNTSRRTPVAALALLEGSAGRQGPGRAAGREGCEARASAARLAAGPATPGEGFSSAWPETKPRGRVSGVELK